jgi:hypothetical protein
MEEYYDCRFQVAPRCAGGRDGAAALDRMRTQFEIRNADLSQRAEAVRQ